MKYCWWYVEFYGPARPVYIARFGSHDEVKAYADRMPRCRPFSIRFEPDWDEEE